MPVDLILGFVLEAVRGARLPPGLEETLLREKRRMELLGELAIWARQPGRDFAQQFTYWHLRRPHSWNESYRTCRESILGGRLLPWRDENSAS